MKQDGGAAFPTPPIILDDDSVGVIPDEHYHGMTMRQWYKGMALIGILSHPVGPAGEWKKCAVHAAAVADAMLADDAAREGKDESR